MSKPKSDRRKPSFLERVDGADFERIFDYSRWFQALGVLNKFGDTPQAHAILSRMKNVEPKDIEAALKAWKAGK